MRNDLPWGTVSLLLTDIEGSTRTLNRLGAARYAEALAAHRDIIRAACSAHGGAEVDTQGDAFFLAFPTLEGAVLAAVDAQRGLASHRWDEGGTIRVRMGIHTGEPQRTEEGYVGMDVHAAARIASAGHGGQVLVSERSARAVGGNLKAGVSLRDLGPLALKDLEAPEHVFQLVISDLPSDFPAPRSLQSRPNNLPTPLTAFVGRAELVSQIRDLLLMPQTRAVTLLGPGGTGKSRLALRVATEVLHSMEDGAFFIALAPITDHRRVVGEIARTLSVREQQGQALIDTLIAELREKELVLLLDNFEQVSEAARDISRLLAGCPGLKVLTTSRQPLRISGERGFPVPPLALPDRGGKLGVEELEKFDAIRLFIDRALSARWDFALTEENAADVVEICWKVDGLPLGIELATAKLYSMSISELRAALEHRLATLDEGAVDLLDHQRTLRDLIAWSYDMLDERERTLWRNLGIFPGGGTLAAAGYVSGAEPSSFDSLLESLANKSLVVLEKGHGSAEKVVDGDSEEGRVSMLETLREFAVDALEGSGDLDAVGTRHLDWFCRLAEQGEPELRGKARDAWVARLDREQPNFRAALQRALTRDVESALKLGSALWFFWYQRGYLSEGREWLERALEADDGSNPSARASALLGVANFDRYQNLAADAEQAAEEALALYRRLGDDQGIANTLTQLGAIYEHQGEYQRAIETLEEAQKLLRALDSNERLSFALVALGAMKQIDGRVDEAVGHYEESLALSRQRGDRNAMLSALINLGEVADLRGDRERARRLLRDSLELAVTLNLRIAIAYCLEVLAGLLAEGDGEFAARLFGAADNIREEIDAPVETWNRERYERDVERLRAMLTPEAAEAAWQAGRSESLAELLAHDALRLDV